jgi:uncharacterized protein YyaL (SSP411 family)
MLRNASRARLAALASALLVLLWVPLALAAPTLTGPWEGWSDGLFKRAAQQKKLVLLDLEARWCHWCHVMEEETYSNQRVAEILNKNFILVRVDQDSRPDLSARYKDYGWPATIIFNSKGEEVEKLSGFHSPDEFLPVLQAAIADPKPREPSQTALSKADVVSSLPDGIRTLVTADHAKAVDREIGGLKTSHRYLDPDSVEFGITRAATGDKENAQWVIKTLDANEKLIDPVWGGVYQYSTRRGWDHPHFEKIMPSQMANIRLYAFAYRVFGEDRYLKDARTVALYLNSFLRGENGAYFTSQDADIVPGQHSDEYFSLGDKDRRARGIPAVDEHQYARENGMAALAMTDLYLTTGETQYLDAATAAAKWVMANRRRPDGGFRHGDGSSEAPYLADTLWMGRGLLALYAATGDRSFLESARQAVDFIRREFPNPEGAGFFSSSPMDSGGLKPAIRLDDNIVLARLANELFRYTGDEQYRATATRALSYAAQRQVLTESISEPGVILAGEELASDPPHVTTVGPKGDAVAQSLFASTRKLPAMYVRREWWDRAEGPMPNPDVQYPALPKAAGFVCANKRCSLPIFAADELRSRIAEVFKPK